MQAIRVRTIVDQDKEIRLRDVPVRKGQHVEVIILQEEDDDGEGTFVPSVLNHDPAWAWLGDREEDLYSDTDLEERYR